MNDDATSPTLLEELDARQDELLDELDRLNLRVEQALAACMIWQSDESDVIPAAA
jgi:hypothetical protein